MTMKELAKLAGVSVSAISRYLNDGPLSQEKRDKIRKAIDETGYQPDFAAQMLRTKTTNLIGLIVPKMDNEAVTRVARGASQVLQENGYLCLYSDSGSDFKKEIEYLKLFEERHVAGIILMASVMTPGHEEFIRHSSVPIVVVGQRFPQTPSIYHNDFGAAYDITNLMIQKGRKKLALIGVTQSDIAVGLNRLKGVKAAMQDAGMNPADLLYIEGNFSVESGVRAMEHILKQDSKPDAVICVTDRMAFGALEALKRHDFRVPEEISVAGMDDNWAGEYVSPHLTTAHFYFKSSGKIAAKQLLSLIENNNPDRPVMQTMLEYKIIERDSI